MCPSSCPQIPEYLPYLVLFVITAVVVALVYRQCREWDREAAKWAAIEFDAREAVTAEQARGRL